MTLKYVVCLQRAQPPANFSQQPTAGHLPRPGLKPLVPPKTHGVAPFASRRAALPARARGLAAAE